MNRLVIQYVKLFKFPFTGSHVWTISFFVYLTLASCFSDEEGAAEVSWALRTFSETSPPQDICGLSNVESIRLCWDEVDADSGQLDQSCASQFRDFQCENQNGSTNFEIPTGRVGFWLVPICNVSDTRFPATEDTYRSPPPVIRDVFSGKIVSLQSHLIEVSDPREDCGPNGCTCETN